MSFGAPHWLEALLIAPLLVALLVRNEVLRDHLLKKLVAARLLSTLAASASATRRRWKFALTLLGLVFVILALAEPRMGENVVINHRLGLDLMIAMDTSKSMLSTDVQPDRLTRAKFAAQDLIDSLEGDRVGMIAFAGTSFVEAPLTVDYSAVENSLTALDTNTIPRGGTNIASAIREAADAFGTGEGKSRALVLFTDGEELEDDAVQAAKDAKGKFQIFTVGVGTQAGSLIPVPNADGATEFLKDTQGQYVKSKLDEEKLKQIATATGGFYVHLENGPATAKAIIDQGLKKLQEHEFESRETQPIERYEWPLAAGILLLIASALIRERRRVAPKPARVPAKPAAKAAVTMALLMLATAHGWSENEGLDLYDHKNYKGAYDIFQNQLQRNPSSDGLEFDRGASAYKEGDYDKALEAFGKVLGSKDPTLRGQAEYNLANTLVQRGALQPQKEQKIKEWTGALNHYDQALKVDPQNPDAKYNRDLVKRMIDELNKKEQQQKQQDQKQQDQKQQDQKQQDQKQQDQKQQDQKQQDQKQQDQKQQDQKQQDQKQQDQKQQDQKQQDQKQQDQKQQDQKQQDQKQNGQGQPKQQQGQQSGGQGQQNQQAQNQPQQQGQNQQPQNSPQPGQSNPKQQPGQQDQNGQNQASASPSPDVNGSPSPTPSNGPGNLQEQPQPGQQQTEAKAAAQGATEAARPGEMTPSQAKALIDSLRGEEQHVSFEDKHADNEPAFKDW